MKGIVIVSGGMDSVTLCYWLKEKYPSATWHYLSFDYGQRHVKELAYATALAIKLGGQHDIVNLRYLGKLLSGTGSVLVDQNSEVPEGHYAEESMRITVVPNRNSIMLSIAVGVAVAERAELVAAGMHAGDHFIYPDCRPEFVRLFNQAEHLANLGFWDGRITAPFVDMSKADIVRLGHELEVDYAETWSCYKGGHYHCGKCGTCVERIEAFELAGVEDPTKYDPTTALR
jgi:7-cyano-7-deazaguanine synthase